MDLASYAQGCIRGTTMADIDSWYSFTDPPWYTDPAANPDAATCQYTESIKINDRVVAINSLGANSYFFMRLIEGLKEWPQWIRALETFGVMKDVVDFQELVKEVFAGDEILDDTGHVRANACLLYTSPSPRDRQKSRMPSSA